MRNINNMNDVHSKEDFVALCEKVSDEVGVDLDFYDEYNESMNLKVVEDDGNLHISCYEIRGVFGIGQDMRLKEYKRIRDRILGIMRIIRE